MMEMIRFWIKCHNTIMLPSLESLYSLYWFSFVFLHYSLCVTRDTLGSLYPKKCLVSLGDRVCLCWILKYPVTV